MSSDVYGNLMLMTDMEGNSYQAIKTTCIIKLYVLSLLNHPIKCCCTICWSYLENTERNMAVYRKSNKTNTRRKKTQFKKGHKFTSTLKRILHG